MTTEEIREALKSVIDPELGINIVDLGLVYGIDLSEEGVVHLELTMTSPMCPLVPVIEKDVRSVLSTLTGVKEVQNKLVWEPAWTPEKMSLEAKLQLGFGGTVRKDLDPESSSG